MLAIKQFQETAKGMPDLLNWAALIDDGILLGKDGGGYDTKAHFTSFKEEIKAYKSDKPRDHKDRRGGGGGGYGKKRFNRPKHQKKQRQA